MLAGEIRLQLWRRMSDRERGFAGAAIAAGVPDAQFLGIERYVGETFSVARIAIDGVPFSFLPAGSVRLGLDLDRFVPDEAQVASYRESAAEMGLPEDLMVILARVTTRPRTVDVPALLVESVPGEVGLDPIDPQAPEVLEVTRRPGFQAELHGPAGRIRVAQGRDGAVRAWRLVGRTHADAVRALAGRGARLLRSDEWEYACGAGSPTLFWWGDRCPCDRHPIGRGRPGGRPDPSGAPHAGPNPFGLRIARDPYEWELVAEPDVLRGGDGGAAICGGAGFFLGWLPLASSYLDAGPVAALGDDRSTCYVRRVIELP